MATECPRCVAERRAERARAEMNIGATATILLTLTLGVLSGLALWPAKDSDHGASTRLIRGSDALPLLIPFAIAAGIVVSALHMVRWLAERRAATPLPSPAAPLATYRAAPTECPRHPFAR